MNLRLTKVKELCKVAQPVSGSQDLDLVQNLEKMLHKICPRCTVSGRGRNNLSVPTDSRGPEDSFLKG